MKRLILSLMGLGLCACSTVHETFKYHDPTEEAAKQEAATQKRMLAVIEQGKPVRIGKEDPPKNYKELGPITASDGAGTPGSWGVPGTYDHAIVILKARAIEMGADYVQIMAVQPPHYEPAKSAIGEVVIHPELGYLGRANFIYDYVISGMAYKAP